MRKDTQGKNSIFRHFGFVAVFRYDGQTIFSDWWRLDLDTMDWTKMMRDPPVPVYFHASSITSVSYSDWSLGGFVSECCDFVLFQNGKLFMFGGVNRIEDNCRTAVVQVGDFFDVAKESHKNKFFIPV